MTLVSIIIPAHNAARWIGETLQSCVDQTYRPLEVLVVDDSSTDGTSDVVRQFGHADLIRVIPSTARNAAATRQLGLTRARGEYIQYLDADDLLSRDKIAEQMALAVRVSQTTMLSSGWAAFYQRPESATPKPSLLWQSQTPADWLRTKMSARAHMQTATWLVSRALSEATGPWDHICSLDDDGEYFARMLLHADRVQWVDKGMVYYRLTPGARLSVPTAAKSDSGARATLLQVQYMRTLDDSQASRAACLTFLNYRCEDIDIRPDLLDKYAQVAAECGGHLRPIRIPPKYAWLVPIIGRQRTRLVQFNLPRVKHAVIRALDGVRIRWRPTQQPAQVRNEEAEADRGER